jgi:hypothetical protein
MLEADDTDRPLHDGGIALVLLDGALVTDSVNVQPAVPG